LEGADVKVIDLKGIEVLKTKTDKSGTIEKELIEYSTEGKATIPSSPYSVIAGKKTYVVNLNKNQNLLITK